MNIHERNKLISISTIISVCQKTLSIEEPTVPLTILCAASLETAVRRIADLVELPPVESPETVKDTTPSSQDESCGCLDDCADTAVSQNSSPPPLKIHTDTLTVDGDTVSINTETKLVSPVITVIGPIDNPMVELETGEKYPVAPEGQTARRIVSGNAGDVISVERAYRMACDHCGKVATIAIRSSDINCLTCRYFSCGDDSCLPKHLYYETIVPSCDLCGNVGSHVYYPGNGYDPVRRCDDHALVCSLCSDSSMILIDIGKAPEFLRYCKHHYDMSMAGPKLPTAVFERKES